MKALYITSIENFSGKTAVCLAVGKRLQAEGHKLGYLKPVSRQPTMLAGHVVDEDAVFVKNVLALSLDPWELCPVVVTPQVLADCIGAEECNFEERVKAAYRKAVGDNGIDVLLLEGGGSLREGYAIRLSTPYVAEMLGATALVVVKYRGRMRLLDDALTADFRLDDKLLGVVLNRIPDQEMDFITGQAIPFLEKKGIPVLGALPERRQLAAISVGELVETLNATILTGEERQEALVETLMVGAMGGQEALSRFRVHPNKAVITGGDRVDIQLAALETSTICMILTGNLRPTAAIVERSREQGVAVMVVPTNTMETVDAIERVFGKTRLGQAEKLARFEALMAEHVDYKRMFDLLGL
jgi:BioD-like phosphotransacetylase family protein